MGELEEQAARQLGEPVIAGLALLRTGDGTQAAFLQAPLFGGVVGLIGAKLRAERERERIRQSHELEIHGDPAYLAVTPTRVALIEVFNQRRGRTLGSVIATFDRSEVRAIEVGRPTSRVGRSVELVIGDGHRYCYEVPTMFYRRLSTVAAAMGIVPDDAAVRALGKGERIAILVLFLVVLLTAVVVIWKLRSYGTGTP